MALLHTAGLRPAGGHGEPQRRRLVRGVRRASGIVDGLQRGYETASNFNVTISTYYAYGKLYYKIQPSASSFVPFYLGQTTQYVYGTTATSSSPACTATTR